jgi:hypothetical protein
MKHAYLIIILFLGFSFYQSASQNIKLTFETICNDRYGFCVDYPKKILYPQPLSGNGDGRYFSNKKGDHILTTYGRRNYTGGEKISLGEQYEEDLRSEELVDEIIGTEKKVITYSKLGNSFFVISGFYRGHIFYEKVVLRVEGFAYAILVYDENEKKIYNQVVDRIFKNFK